MKAALTIWIPVIGFVALTAAVIVLKRRSADNAPTTDRITERHLRTESVNNVSKFEVIDGDSIKVTFGADIPVSIRLSGIDAPELGQYYGYESKENLRKKLGEKAPQLTFEGNDKYGRKVCTVTVENQNLNLQLVESGFAWATLDADSAFQEAQRIAQEKGVGLWSGDNLIAPWDWRNRN